MNETPYASRDQISHDQLSKLRQLLRLLIPANGFYTARLQAAGFDSEFRSLEEFSARLPFTFKQDIVDDQRANPPYGTNLTFSLDMYTRYNQTSATTGTPIRWLDTERSWDQLLDNWVQVYEAAGVGCNDRVYFAFSFGPFLGFWTAFGAAAKMGCLCLPGGGLNSVARLLSILDNEATVLCCTPTYAVRLAEVAESENIDLNHSKMRAIIVAGEPGGSVPATRAHIEQQWPGARVYDHYGMTEVGPVCYECPKVRGVLHILEHAYFPEFIDPESGSPIEPGQTSELVLTTLLRPGSPLLRYRTGDLVKVSANAVCDCGHAGSALEGGILGRSDDMILVRGANLYPAGVEEIVRRHKEIVEYRVEIRTIHAMTEPDILIELSSNCAEGDEVAARLQKDLRTAFNLRIPVRIVAPGELPRFDMKAKRWIRLDN